MWPIGRSQKQGKCCQWKAKGNFSKGDACSFRHDDSKRGMFTCSSPNQKSQMNHDGTSSSEGKPPRGSSPSGYRHLGPPARARRVIRGTLPCVEIVNHKQAANFARSVRSCTRRRTARSTSKELAQIPRVILGILPSARTTKHKQAAGSAKERFLHGGADRQPNERTKKGG